jgi:hypothetical protein
VELMDVLNEKKIVKIYCAETLFTLVTPVKKTYYVVEINCDIITLFTEDYTEVNLKISDIINFEMYNAKINNSLNKGDEIVIIISSLSFKDPLEIVDIKINKCM